MSFFQALLLTLPALSLSQVLPAYHWSEIESRMSHSAETLYVINFWSTWCRPCIAELPLLQAAYEKLKEQIPVQIWLISLDLPPDGAQKAAQLLRQKRIYLPALWLNESDPNQWIPHVDSMWDGAIPYTRAWNVPLRHTTDFSSVGEIVDFVKKAYDTLRSAHR
ncbi:MAG: TlpA family protein disulfide reductase [Bacteroidia bacterium]|nr:TlpA family protein disulfide reductase [Bacteroidia bacterium]MDW8417459.1 TlpA disulfide reductase family protein [Bacteroidia bacterium]